MAAWDSSIRRFSEKRRSMYSTFRLHPLRRQGDLSTARVGLIDRRIRRIKIGARCAPSFVALDS